MENKAAGLSHGKIEETDVFMKLSRSFSVLIKVMFIIFIHASLRITVYENH